MPAILTTVSDKRRFTITQNGVQIYTGKTVETVLLSEILFILFPLHLLTT